MKITSHWKLASTVAIAGLCICRISFAQTRVNIPSVKPAPHARWTITYQDQGDKSAPTAANQVADSGIDPATGKPKNKRVLKENYEIGDKISYVQRSYADGSNDMIYMVNKVAFISDPVTKAVRAELFSVYSGNDVRFAEKYPGFDWINEKFLVDEQTIGDHKHLHFRQGVTGRKVEKSDDVSSGLSYDANATSTGREAWIDEETKLPYAFRNGTITGVYAHLAPSDEPVTLPAAILKAVRYYNGYDN